MSAYDKYLNKNVEVALFDDPMTYVGLFMTITVKRAKYFIVLIADPDGILEGPMSASRLFNDKDIESIKIVK